MERPSLRPIEIIAAPVNGAEALVLRDPLSIAGGMLAMPRAAGALLQLLDGERSLAEIRAEFARRTGQALAEETLAEFVGKLDEALFLEGERFERARDEAVAAFARSSVRPAAHLGGASPDDAEPLRTAMDGFFDGPDGPGRPLTDAADAQTPICAVLAPHIDLARGGPCYAWAYKAVAERTDADLFVLLGVAHQGTRNLYVPLNMDYETPFGPAPVDRDFMGALARRFPVDAGQDLLVHRTDHTIEFQAAFLQYLFGGKRDYRIAPILCSWLGDAGGPFRSPGQVQQVADFIGALREAVAECGRKACFVGGVDLAHVGHKFGDKVSAAEYGYERLQSEDAETLRAVLSGDGEAFYAQVMRDGNARNVCGVPAIYALLEAARPSWGELLRYGQALEPETGSVVSFAAVALG